ncbi:uncharacterized protein BXZ73DRAFT_100479, partial [Epithele typhae]|uniref:uncharacterized protein n=1 Tax=Epithele typhae TaxID=378194 RepID=UPI002008454B
MMIQAPTTSTSPVAHALADTVARLHAQGRLRDGTQLATALEGLVERVRVASEGGPEWTDPVEEYEAKKEAEGGEKDKEKKAEEEFGPLRARTNALEVLEVIEEIARANPGVRRQLVHLIDVHQSVQGSLDSSAGAARHVHYNRMDRAEDGLDPEVV